MVVERLCQRGGLLQEEVLFLVGLLHFLYNKRSLSVGGRLPYKTLTLAIISSDYYSTT